MTADVPDEAILDDAPIRAVEVAARALFKSPLWFGWVGNHPQLGVTHARNRAAIECVRAVLADTDARAAILAALDHEDCVPREEHADALVAGGYANHLKERYEEQAVRAEQEHYEAHKTIRVLIEGLNQAEQERDRLREAVLEHRDSHPRPARTSLPRTAADERLWAALDGDDR